MGLAEQAHAEQRAQCVAVGVHVAGERHRAGAIDRLGGGLEGGPVDVVEQPVDEDPGGRVDRGIRVVW